MTTISKKDTQDIADSIANEILGFTDVPESRINVISRVIEDVLNNWIRECESEEAEYKRCQNDITPGTGEMMDGDY